MLQLFQPIRILQGLLIMLIYMNLVLSTQSTNKDAINSFYYKKSYTSIINDLRDHWQSPIAYLKKRGYLPKIKNEPDMNCIKLTEDANLNGFNSEMEIDNLQQDLKKRQSSSATNHLGVENYQGNPAKTADIKPLTNSLTVENYQANLAKSDDKPLLAVENYQANLAKSDDKQPLAVENYQGNLAKTDDKQPLTNSAGQQPAANHLNAVEIDQANPTKTANKLQLSNNLAVENVLENLIKSNDKPIGSSAKDFPLVKIDDTGFFTNMKNKFLGLFRSGVDNPIKIKNTKLLKELENDIQKELNKGTLTKTYAQKAVQTVVSNDYNFLEKDLINYYDNGAIKYDVKNA